MGKKLKERTKVNLGEEMPDDDESALARLKNILILLLTCCESWRRKEVWG